MEIMWYGDEIVYFIILIQLLELFLKNVQH